MLQENGDNNHENPSKHNSTSSSASNRDDRDDSRGTIDEGRGGDERMDVITPATTANTMTSAHYDDIDLSNPRLKFTPDVLRDLILPRGRDHFTKGCDPTIRVTTINGAGGSGSVSVTVPPLMLHDRVFSSLMGSPVGNDVLEIEEM